MTAIVDSTGVQIIWPEWPAPPRVRAAFTLRHGGVSSAPFNSLNVGAHVGDEAAAVAENRRRVRAYLHLPAEPAWMEQVHGIDVVDLDAATPAAAQGAHTDAAGIAVAGAFRADGALTRRCGCVCVVQVADCLPVLLAARDGSAVAAAHAGWRGLAAGVLEATVKNLAAKPADLIAWLGPGIGAAHFEVGDEVRRAFLAHDAGAANAFAANTRGRWQCDLAGLARRRLAALGIGAVFGGEWCTYTDPSRFFSYRRDARSGRMAALIWREE
jgi:YfiH family protein